MKPTASRFERAARHGSEAAWSYEPKLAAAYQALIKQAADQAARLLPSVALAAAGQPGTPSWSLPHQEELGSQLRAIYATDKKTGPIRVEAMRAASTPTLAVIGLSFTLRNPFIEGVLRQVGKSIDVTDTTRRQIMEVLNTSWEKGDSVVHAAEALRAYGIDNSRGLLIARTELNAISNGGSMAAALTSARESDAQPGFDGLPPLLKLWLTAEDDRVRDTHVEAGDAYGAGNGIPLDAPFFVGGSELLYPGDPDGPADEICNCRCAISYEEASGVTAAAPRPRMGARMSTNDTVPPGLPPGAKIAGEVMDAVADANEWVGCLCIEGMATSDHRFLAVDSIGWRPLPLTLTAQLVTDEGHDSAVVAGRIERIEKMPIAEALAAGLVPDGRDYPPDAVAVIGYGCFSDTGEGFQVMRLVADRDLRGVSIELAVSEGELVELAPEPGEDMGELLDVTVKAEIAAACVVAFPAFAEAQIMLASQAEGGGLPLDAEVDDEAAVAAAASTAWRFSLVTAQPVRMRRELTAAAPRFSAVDYSGGCMVAVSPHPQEAADIAQPGGQPAGELHVTLAHLPNPDGVDFAKLNRLVAKVAADHDAVQGAVGGAGYFAAAEQPGIPAKPADGADGADYAPAVAAAADPAPAETDATDTPPDDDPKADPEAAPLPKTPEQLHPHVALVDAPGLSGLRAKLADAMDKAGVEYSQNHDFVPHLTVGYEATPGAPAMHLAGKPLSFSHVTVHEGLNRTAHPLAGGDAMTASAAGAAPVKPPLAWFADPELTEPTPMTVDPDGRVYGHLATWGVCHVGISDACVRPPRNSSGYRMFHLGELETSEGEFIAVGTLTMDTGHADLRLNAAATKRHYDDTGVGAIDCCIGEDRHGIWMAGAVRPELSMSAVRRLRASKPSGDWRTVGGSFEMIGVLAVNTPGFPVPRPRARVLPALAAAGGERVTSLIAAGIDLVPSDGTVPDPARLWFLFDRVLPGSSAARVQALAAAALAQ